MGDGERGAVSVGFLVDGGCGGSRWVACIDGVGRSMREARAGRTHVGDRVLGIDNLWRFYRDFLHKFARCGVML